MNRRFSCVLKIVIGLALLVSASGTALAEEFYKGKTIYFIVGFPPGGGYDTYTRAIARHIGNYIPGNPTTIVQNMTGAATLVSAHYIYNGAKPDGLTVGVWDSGLVLRQALGDRAIKFEADQFGWIGAPSKGFPVCAVMGFTGLKTLKDVLNSKKPIKTGGNRGVVIYDLPMVLNLTLGTNFDVIPGYEGTARIRIGMQIRELDGACWNWESMRVTARTMLDAKGDDKLIPFLITGGDSQDPEVKDLPRLTEIIKRKENRAIVNAYLQQFNFQRPLSLPPGTPKARLSILRKAFKATLEDPKFLAQAKKSKLIIEYVSGEEIEKFVDEILAISSETKAKLQFLANEKEK
ncbi:MAG TPA: hypothetical protein VEG60_33305 [Candidatus Binatia bacterium]|nr:hypothetical protein [Candidatus Binatia bacterium]